MNKQPLYDNDYVTVSYLKEYVGGESADEELKFSKNYGSQPTPPYKKNDTWTSSKGIYVCIKDRDIGNFVASDWELIVDTPTLNQYVLDEEFDLKQLLSKTNDGKITTYYQGSDPSINWDTSLERENHIYDMWKQVGAGDQKIFLKYPTDPVTYGWAPQTAPNIVWASSGTKTIHYNKPTNYNIGDIWIINIDTIDLPTNCSIGDWVYATASSIEYNSSNWTKDPSLIDQDALNNYSYTEEAQLINNINTALATEGGVAINGANITAGSIKSRNYVQGSQGMKIALDEGTIDSANFKTDKYGNVYLGTGAKVIGGDGLMTNLQFTTNTDYLGHVDALYRLERTNISTNVYIPSNFTIVSASITLLLFSTTNIYGNASGPGTITNKGKVQHIQLYKPTNANVTYTNAGGFGTFIDDSSMTSSNIVNIYGSSGYNATTDSYSTITKALPTNIFTKGASTTLALRTSDDYSGESRFTDTNVTNATKQTQVAFATINIFGYTSL